jgi:succinate dehydrogenase/fumarate reductase-like Fe-S protein
MKKALRILRGAAPSGRFDEYQVDLDPRATLLDALEVLRTGAVPDLAYRHSCHHGSCGTCGVRIDGVEALACLTPLSSVPPGARVEPLRVFEPLGPGGDLAVDPGLLFRALPEGSTRLRRSDGSPAVPGVGSAAGMPADAGSAPSGDDAANLRAATARAGGDADPVPASDSAPAPAAAPVRFEDCIECGLCVSACPVCIEGASFMGPAALANLSRECANRPERRLELHRRASEADGVEACDRHFACSRACPRGVAPGRHIQGLRKEIAGLSQESLLVRTNSMDVNREFQAFEADIHDA